VSDSTETSTRSAAPIPERDHLDVGGHSLAAYDIECAAEYAERWRDGQLRAAGRLIQKHDARTTGKLPAEARAKVGEYFARADTNAQRAEKYREIRDGHLAKVRSEPRVYGPGSEASYYLDLARSALPGTQGHIEAVARLERYTRELSVEAKAGSAEGKRALAIASTRARGGGRPGVEAERRAMTSGSGSGGAFVTPQYLEADYGLWNSFAPSFIDQATQVADEGYGMTLNLPAFSSAATAAAQTPQNTAISDSTPGAGFLSANMTTIAGEVETSQQQFDRTGPLGIDEILYTALRQQVDTSADLAAITIALSGAGTVAGASSFTAAGLYGDVAKARAQMLTTDGTKLPSTHCFMQPSFYEWAIAQVDPSGRPLLLPENVTAVMPFTPSPGWTGERLLGTGVFTNGQIPASGSNTQIILTNQSEVFVVRSQPGLRAIPETYANNLTVVIQCYQYVACIVRHPAGAVQVLSGAAYPASPTFA